MDGYGGDVYTVAQPNLYRPAPSIQRVVNYSNMFSENPHHPSYSYKFSQSYMPIPGRAPLYFPPQTHVRSGRTERNVEVKVAGHDRYKFFKRPLVGDRGLTSMADTEDLQPAKADYSQADNANPSVISNYKQPEEEDYSVKDAATQSDYRENEVQTDPYEPEYIIPENETNPEVLALRELNFTDGQEGGRIGMDQLKIIDRVRRRRKVEAELPMGTDNQEFDDRVNRLKALEMLEWQEREEEIAKEQEERLQLIRQAFEDRERVKESRNRERVQSRKKLLEEQTLRKLKRLDERRQKHVRKITKKYDNPEMKLPKRDILEEYAFYGSKTYAPPPRDGKLTDLNPIAYEIRPALLTDPFGIEQVEQTQVRKVVDIDIPPTQKVRINTGKPKNSKERKLQTTIHQIEYAKKELDQVKKKTDAHAEKLQKLHEIYKAPPKVVRPPTPKLYESDEEDTNEEEAHNAAILLQKLLRGRAVQCEFDEGKERSLVLIRELQGVEEVKEKERDNHRREIERERESSSSVSGLDRDSILDTLQGKLVSNALDYLAKELIRQREMQKIEELMNVAEAERLAREQQELARRAKEEKERKKREEEFELAISTYNQTATAYLFNVIEEAIDIYSYKQALVKVQEITEKKEEETKDLDDETHIKQLVASFLIPQVKRELLKKKVEEDQRKIVKAVHETMEETTKHVSQVV